MSSMELYAVRKTGNVEAYGDVDNAWQGSVVTWRTLEERYLPAYRPSFVPAHIKDEDVESYLGYKPVRMSAFEAEPMKEVWDLINSPKLSLVEKWAMGSTFDNVIVEREAFDDVIHAFQTFALNVESSNLAKQAELIQWMKEEDDIIGVAWSTSLITCPWLVEVKVDSTHEEWDEEYAEDGFCEIQVPYNIFTGDDKHWFLNREEKMSEPKETAIKED